MKKTAIKDKRRLALFILNSVAMIVSLSLTLLGYEELRIVFGITMIIYIIFMLPCNAKRERQKEL